MTDKLLLDARGAADALSISVRSLERLAADGALPSFRVRGLRRYRASDLAAFVADLGDGDAASAGPLTAHEGGQVRGRLSP
jgi:excisionase family DNA binding protein